MSKSPPRFVINGGLFATDPVPFERVLGPEGRETHEPDPKFDPNQPEDQKRIWPMVPVAYDIPTPDIADTVKEGMLHLLGETILVLKIGSETYF
jgi:hypothetical protein